MEHATKVGLVLGKFAPLHRGHQFLIETALSQVDLLYVLVYDAKETTHIPLDVRCNWIRTLYPNVILIVGRDAPTDVGYTEKVMRLQENYILSVIPEKITHLFSSEPYGEHVSKALGAINVTVDLNRSTIPLSATFVRENPLQSSKCLHPVVNRDVVRKVVLLGAESTGKSTLTNALAMVYNTEAVAEMGRWYWDNYHDINGELTENQLVELANLHRESEEVAFGRSNGITFIDTNAITTWTYSQHYGRPSPELDALACICKYRYDLVLLCGTDIPFVQDGTRLPEENREKFQRQLEWKLEQLNIIYHVIRGPVEYRINTVKHLIESNLGIKA